MNSAEMFSLALQHHQAGNLHQAERYYRHILQTDPAHSSALNGLAVVLAQQGKLADAAACLQLALQIHPDDVHLRHNLGLLFSRQGNHGAAIGQYQQVLRHRPDFVEAHFNLGNAHRNLRQLNEASASYREALRLQPDHAWARHNLGAALLEQGRLEEALTCFQQALRVKPDFAEALVNMGNAHLRQEKFDEAVNCFRQALQLKPDFPEGWYNLGNTLKRQGKPDEAIRCYQEALRLRPNYAEACNNLGSALTMQDKLAEAITWYAEAIRFKPHYEAAHYNWGNALARQDRLQEAIHCYQEAIRLKPNYPAACTNLGILRQQQGQLDEALACFEQALRQDAARAEAHFNRALLWLLLGDWVQGWPEYEWRFQTEDFPRCPLPQPRWDGSPLAGRTLLVLAEQGLGDTLLFLRYVLLLQERGERVILQCQPPLLRLLTDALGNECLVVQGAPLPDFDVYAPLLSLPGILGTCPTNVPAAVPYLHARADLVEHWRRELNKGRGARDEGRECSLTLSSLVPRPSSLDPFLVGLAWQGTAKFRGDRQRSIPLAQFARLAQVPGVRLISLQKGAGTDQLRLVAGQFPVLDLASRLDETSGPFVDSAAVMINLDLVITSDTAVPHLAGALGVPVWVALPLVPDWRWLLEREDSPWYPTMRLFRQTRYGKWEDVFERMAEEMKAALLDTAASTDFVAPPPTHHPLQ